MERRAEAGTSGSGVRSGRQRDRDVAAGGGAHESAVSLAARVALGVDGPLLRAGGAGRCADRAPNRADGPVIVVELAAGVRVNVTAAAPASLVAATLKALR